MLLVATEQKTFNTNSNLALYNNYYTYYTYNKKLYVKK